MPEALWGHWLLRGGEQRRVQGTTSGVVLFSGQEQNLWNRGTCIQILAPPLTTYDLGQVIPFLYTSVSLLMDMQNHKPYIITLQLCNFSCSGWRRGLMRGAGGRAGAGYRQEKGEGSPEAKFGLCSHTWHLQALDLVLLGSGTGLSPSPRPWSRLAHAICSLPGPEPSHSWWVGVPSCGHIWKLT